MTIGCDEVGLGALAGPVVVSAVALWDDQEIPGVKDSKKIKSYDRRASIAGLISDVAPFIVIAGASSNRIDAEGISPCKHACIRQCVLQAVDRYPEARVVVDGIDPIPGLRCELIPKADQKIHAVSAASIMAKVFRDSIMRELAHKHPAYDWWSNFGYGTPVHMQTIRDFGPCKHHRFTYALPARST